MEMTGQGCTHHVPHQSPGTRFPRRFGACFQLYFHAGWLPAVTGVGFFLSPRLLPTTRQNRGLEHTLPLNTEGTCLADTWVSDCGFQSWVGARAGHLHYFCFTNAGLERQALYFPSRDARGERRVRTGPGSRPALNPEPVDATVRGARDSAAVMEGSALRCWVP